MGWIGITDHNGGWFAALKDNAAIASDALLTRGTLLLEIQLSPEIFPRTLFAFQYSYPWSGGLWFRIMPNGGIVMVEAQGNDLRHVALPQTTNTQIETVRLSYCWDAPRRWARLILERLDTDTVQAVNLHAPRPLPLADMRPAIQDPRRREMDPRVSFAAISDNIEPVGPMPGLSGRTPVLTAVGEKPADRLKRGDLVMTERETPRPVLQMARRTVPTRGSFRPIRLRAPYFGLTRDIVVAPQQRLVMGGTQVEYLFGTESVLVPARHLVNGVSALHVDGPNLVTYHGLLLAEHDAVLAAGSPVDTLYVSRIRRKPQDFTTSVLAGFDRSRLPEHAKPAWPVLKPYETAALLMSRVA